MHWFVSLQLFSGILYARRTLRQLTDRNLIGEKMSAAVAVTIFTSFFIISFACFEHPLVQMSLLILICLALLFCDHFFQYRLRIRIQSEFPDFINRILLAMKTGSGFRAAVEKTLAPQIHIWEKWMLVMIESHVFLRPNQPADTAFDDSWWHEYLHEMQVLQQNPHHAIVRLESLRRKLKVLSEFRRKSGHALLQARIQIIVMTVLYLALLAITMNQFHVYQHRRLILLSLALFVLGQFTFWWIARKRLWKV